jgi:endonuclease/exonuclease/phosphatase family metal-dependent hydrolase
MKVVFSWSTRNIFRILVILAMMFVLFLTVMTAADYQPDETEALAIEGEAPDITEGKREFSIVTWNIGYFGLGEGMDFFYDGGQGVRPSRTEYEIYEKEGTAYFRDLDSIDLILLQEVDRNSKRSYRNDQYRKISETLPDHASVFAANYVVPFVPVPLTRPMGKVKSGITLFSKYMPSDCRRGALPGQYSWPKRLFMLDRCFILARFPVRDGKELVIINTHNEAFDGGDIREQQMKHLRAVMFGENDKGNYVVAGGDWNMNPAEYEAGEFGSGDVAMVIEPRLDPRFFRRNWHWAFDPRLPTNRDVIAAYQRGETPTTIIDFFVTSPNIEVLEVRTMDLEFKWSDHNPVMIRFRLAD